MLRTTAFAGLALLAGCNGTETRTPTTDVDATAQGGTGAPGSGTPSAAATGAPPSCSSDADCRTFASYCADAPCACKALAKSSPDPACVGTKVECFAAPCMGKAAACQAGHCELVLGH